MMLINKLQVVGRSYLLLCLMVLIVSEVAQAQKCEISNADLDAMPEVIVQFDYANGEQLQVAARLADNTRTRAAGFQKICAQTIAQQPILFVFQRQTKPSFHMRNVVASLAIAFIKKNGEIDSIQAMSPYVLGSTRRPLYSPQRAVIAALEVYPEFYSERKIDTTVSISWHPPSE